MAYYFRIEACIPKHFGSGSAPWWEQERCKVLRPYYLPIMRYLARKIIFDISRKSPFNISHNNIQLILRIQSHWLHKNSKIDVKVKVQYLSYRIHHHSPFTKELKAKGTKSYRQSVPLRWNHSRLANFAYALLVVWMNEITVWNHSIAFLDSSFYYYYQKGNSHFLV